VPDPDRGTGGTATFDTRHLEGHSKERPRPAEPQCREPIRRLPPQKSTHREPIRRLPPQKSTHREPTGRLPRQREPREHTTAEPPLRKSTHREPTQRLLLRKSTHREPTQRLLLRKSTHREPPDPLPQRKSPQHVLRVDSWRSERKCFPRARRRDRRGVAAPIFATALRRNPGSGGPPGRRAASRAHKQVRVGHFRAPDPLAPRVRRMITSLQ
jgi:hypothetical protein